MMFEIVPSVYHHLRVFDCWFCNDDMGPHLRGMFAVELILDFCKILCWTLISYLDDDALTDRQIIHFLCFPTRKSMKPRLYEMLSATALTCAKLHNMLSSFAKAFIMVIGHNIWPLFLTLKINSCIISLHSTNLKFEGISELLKYMPSIFGRKRQVVDFLIQFHMHTHNTSVNKLLAMGNIPFFFAFSWEAKVPDFWLVISFTPW